jgi:hypothetical protein
MERIISFQVPAGSELAALQQTDEMTAVTVVGQAERTATAPEIREASGIQEPALLTFVGLGIAFIALSEAAMQRTRRHR